MPFPTGFTTRTHIAAPPNGAKAAAAVRDRLERALYGHHARIIHRGEDFFEFKIPVGARIARDFGSAFNRPAWSPLSFISGGTIRLTEQLGVYRVTAELRTHAYPGARLALAFAIGALITPVHGVLPRLLAGIVVGLAFGGVSYPLARWQFGPWLERTGAEITDDAASGRLTSASIRRRG